MPKKIAILFLVSMAGITEAQSPCHPKIRNENGRNSCDFFEGKSDTDKVIFTVGLTRPPSGQENTPENRANLRKWTDTLFLKHDVSLIGFGWTMERSQPPADSLLSWVYMIYVQKSIAFAIADEEFISVLEYRDSLPQVASLRPRSRQRARFVPGQPMLFEINGRLCIPAKADQDKARASGKILYEREH